jgi:TonB-dependent receptor
MRDYSLHREGFFYTILLIFFLINSASANTRGKIIGKITDKKTGEALVGANVQLEKTAIGTSTDIEGNYTISSVPPGDYTIRVTYIGYKKETRPVSVKPGKTLTIDFQLILGMIEGETVVITAQAEGQVAAINQQLRSNTITNVVSAERIKEIPDANAAESVGRLPGVSIKRSGGEGNKVVIRGLSPNYNAITVAGDRLPATDLDDRSVDLSMIAPEILAGIEVTKALTPDKDADALGGTVDFKLTTASKEGFKFHTRMQSSYNDQRNVFGLYKGGFILSNRFLESKLGLLVTSNIEKTNRGSDRFSASYSIPREKREGEEFAPITTDAVRFEHSLDIRQRYGFNVMMDYEIPNGKLLLNTFFSRLDRDEIVRQKRYDMGGSNKLRYYLEDRQRQIDIFTSSLSGEHDLSFVNLDWRVSRNASTTRHPFASEFEFEEVGAFDTGNIPQIATPEDILNNAYNLVDETYLRKGKYEPERSFERDLTAQVNLKVPYLLTSNLVGHLKFGAKFREKLRERDRDYLVRRLDITDDLFEVYHSKYNQPGFVYERMPGTNYAKMNNYLDPSFDAGTFLDGRYDFGVGLDAAELEYFLDKYLMDNVYRFSLERDLDDYSVTDRLTAGYIMTELNLGNHFMFMPGARYETTTLDATGKAGVVNSEDEEGNLDYNTIRDTTSLKSYGEWFPMIHFRAKPTHWFDVRLAYTQTVSYPRLDYIIPAKRIKAASKIVEYGNTLLNPQLATNYDIYLSFYGRKIGLLTLGAFYKNITNLIYLRSGHIILDPVKEGVADNLKGFAIVRPENNINDTKVYGLEVEWQTNFSWLPGPFNGFVFSINYSHLWSETHFPRSFVKRERISEFPFLKSTVIDTFRTGPMPDLASDIANISLGYDQGPFSGRLSMLLQGKTLSFVGVREELDGFTDTYLRWDMTLTWDLTKHYELFYNMNNLTDRPDESYMQTARYPTSREFYGWTSDFGVAIKF